MAQPVPFNLQHSKVSQNNSISFNNDFSNTRYYGLRLFRFYKVLPLFFWYFRTNYFFKTRNSFINDYLSYKYYVLMMRRFVLKRTLKIELFDLAKKNKIVQKKHFFRFFGRIRFCTDGNSLKLFFVKKFKSVFSSDWLNFRYKSKTDCNFFRTFLFLSTVRYLQLKGGGLFFFFLKKYFKRGVFRYTKTNDYFKKMRSVRHFLNKKKIKKLVLVWYYREKKI